jgi:epsin
VGQTVAPAKPSGDAFGSLWSSALGKDTTKKDSGTKVSMAQLAQEKSTNALWGGTAPTQQQGRQGQGQTGGSSSSGLDDLLF